MNEKSLRSSSTYQSKIVTANVALACLQYPLRFGFTGGPHDFVIYHGAPGCGCSGSLISDAAWLWMLMAYKVIKAECTMTETIGSKQWVMNMIPFTSNTNIDRTAMMTLNLVVLF